MGREPSSEGRGVSYQTAACVNHNGTEVYGTSRHFNALPNLVAIGGVADIDHPYRSSSIYDTRVMRFVS